LLKEKPDALVTDPNGIKDTNYNGLKIKTRALERNM